MAIIYEVDCGTRTVRGVPVRVTELIWAGEHNKCLPTYPLPPCVE